MQSTAIVIIENYPKIRTSKRSPKKQKPAATETVAPGFQRKLRLDFRFCLQHLATTVKAGRANVMTQMDFASRRFNCNTWNNQSIVRAVHTALGRRFFVLLDSHDSLLGESAAQTATHVG
jgi:hypothetical protein